MLHSKSYSMRLISTAIAVVFMIVTILASTESVSAAAKLKVTAERQTIYVGETVKLKANKKVKWSVSKKKIVKLTKVKKKSVVVKGQDHCKKQRSQCEYWDAPCHQQGYDWYR